jgi:hypothetical protein
MTGLIRRRSLLFTTALVLAALHAPRMALCLGEDGHGALELASADCCPTAADARASRPEHGDHAEPDDGRRDCASECTDSLVSVDGRLELAQPTTDKRPEPSPFAGFLAVAPGSVGAGLLGAAHCGRNAPLAIGASHCPAARNAVRRL